MSAEAPLLDRARQLFRAGQDLEARLVTAAAVRQIAQEAGATAVVVGGTAVDFYAAKTLRGGFEPSRRLRASEDLDVVVVGIYGGAARVRQALKERGWTATTGIPGVGARGWMAPDLPVLVEILGEDLAGARDRLFEVEIEGGLALLWSPEDTLWQYAENAWSQRSRYDWERAVVIAAVQSELIEWKYLEGVVRDEGKPREIIACAREGTTYDEMMERVAASRRA